MAFGTTGNAAAPAGVLPKGFFKGVKSSKPLVDANYIKKEGHYLLKVEKFKIIQAGPQRNNVMALVHEFQVLAVLNLDGDGKSHKVGEYVTEYVEDVTKSGGSNFFQ